MVEALGLDLKEIIFVIINFLILVGVLGKFIYKPFLGALEHRKQTIQEAFDKADATSKRADAKMAKYNRRVANAEEECREIIKEGKKQADAQAQIILAEAQQQAEEITARAEKAMELEREKFMDSMRDEVAQLALMAAEQIVGRELQVTGHEAVVDEVIRSASTLQPQN